MRGNRKPGLSVTAAAQAITGGDAHKENHSRRRRLLRTNNQLHTEQITQLAVLNQQTHLIALLMVGLSGPLTDHQREMIEKVTEVNVKTGDSFAGDLCKRLRSFGVPA